ncbi:hypothetical protein [Streptomyces sp. KL118A]|nr:hypothetical protein [Streptomyces sp. KL118A]
MADEAWVGLAEAIGAVRGELRRVVPVTGEDARVGDDVGERPR